MMRLCLIVYVLIFFSCNTQKTPGTNQKVAETPQGPGAASVQDVQIDVKMLSLLKEAKKFKIIAVIQNETGVTSFSQGDTVTLYPNYMRSEGKEIDMKSPENEHMNALQNIKQDEAFSVTIKIRGRGKNRYGLIMDWEK
jgi:hypothetical protein